LVVPLLLEANNKRLAIVTNYYDRSTAMAGVHYLLRELPPRRRRFNSANLSLRDVYM
jgi:hypothetical protein